MRPERVSKLARLLVKSGSMAILAPSSSLFYLLGLDLVADERLVAGLFWPDGRVDMVVPALYAEEVASRLPGIEAFVWNDGENPYGLVARRLKGMAISEVLVDNGMWAEHLIGLQGAVPGVKWGAVTPLLREMRRVKDGAEIDALKKAAGIVDRALAATLPAIRVGMTEKDVAWNLEREIRENGGERLSFPSIVAFGSNGALPHYRAGERVLREGDTIVMDFGCVRDGYCSDITRTVALGTPPPQFTEVYDVVRKAHDEAMKAVRPGRPCQDVDRAARRVISESGYGKYFIHRTGHGIGLDGHEEPYIVEGNAQPLEEGMTFSIEPGIYLPGRFGVRIEDIVVVTGTGGVSLNEYPTDLIRIKAARGE